MVSLARDVNKDTAPDNPQPIGHSARFSGNRIGWGSDSYTINYHGYSYSHIDALPHTGVGGSLLSIGSAAGVALMGQARGYYTFFGHLKWTPVIFIGYIASIYVHVLMAGLPW